MSWLEKNGAAIAALHDDLSLMVAISIVREHHQSKGIKHDFGSIAQSLNALSQDDGEAQALKSRLANKSLDVAKVIAQWEKFKISSGDGLSDKYSALVYSLNELKTPQPGVSSTIIWPLIEQGDPNAAIPTSTKLELNFSSNAKLEIEAGPSKEKDSLPKAFPKDFSIPGSQRLVRLGAEGLVKAELGANVPLGVFNAGGGVEGELKAALNWYFANDAQKVFVSAIADSLEQLTSPFDLSELRDLFGNTQTPLACLAFQMDGTQSFKGSMKVSKAALPLAGAAMVGVDASFEYRVKRGGEYRYLMHDDGNGSLVLSVRRSRLKEQGRSSSIQLEFDFTSLYSQLFKIVLDSTDKMLAIIEEMQSILPRDDVLRVDVTDWLDEKLEDSSHKDLIKAAIGFDPEKKADQLLAEMIMSEVETSTARWNDKADAATEGVVDKVLAKLGVTGQTAQQVRGLILPKAEEVIDKENARLNDKVRHLIEDDERWKKLTGLMAEVGKDVDQHITNLNDRFNAIIGPMREVTNTFQKQVTKVRDALQVAAESKLKLKWTREQSTSESIAVDLRLRFLNTGDDANDLYLQMLTGSLDALTSAVNGDIPSTDVELIDGELTQLIKSDDARGFEIGLFGITSRATRSLDIDAEYSVNSNGDVCVMSRAEIAASRAVLGEDRRLAFVNVFELATAESSKSLSLDLTLSQSDDDVTLKDVKGFFASLEQGGLLANGVTTKAIERLNNISEQVPGAKVKGKLDVGFGLSGEQIDTLLGKDANGQPRLSKDSIMHTVAYELEAVDGQVSAIFGDSYKEREYKIKRNFPQFRPPLPTDLHSLILILDDETRTKAERQADDIYDEDIIGETHLIRDLKMLNHYHNHAVNICNLVDELYRVYYSSHDTNQWDAADYQDSQKKLDGYLKDWLRVNKKFIFFLPDEVRPLTVAFIRIMAKLSGVPLSGDQSVLSAKLTLGDKVFDLTGA